MSQITDAHDKINQARYLVEAIFLAAFGLGDMHQTNAIQTVCEEVKGRLQEAQSILETDEAARMTGGRRNG